MILNGKRFGWGEVFLLISIFLGLFSLFGQGIIARSLPNYSTYKKEAIEKKFQELDKSDLIEVQHTLILYVQSKDFYLRVKNISVNIAILALVFFVIALFSWNESHLAQFKRSTMKSKKTELEYRKKELSDGESEFSIETS